MPIFRKTRAFGARTPNFWGLQAFPSHPQGKKIGEPARENPRARGFSLLVW